MGPIRGNPERPLASPTTESWLVIWVCIEQGNEEGVGGGRGIGSMAA